MSERAPRLRRGEILPTPEEGRASGEQTPIQRCVAEVTIRTLPNTNGSQSETTISCTACPFKTKEPYKTVSSPFSDWWKSETATEYRLRQNCIRWKAMADKGEVPGKMPKDFHPPFKHT